MDIFPVQEAAQEELLPLIRPLEEPGNAGCGRDDTEISEQLMGVGVVVLGVMTLGFRPGLPKLR